MSQHRIAFVRHEMLPEAPPPALETGGQVAAREPVLVGRERR